MGTFIFIFNIYFCVFLITFRVFSFYVHSILRDKLNFYYNRFLNIFECGFSNFNLLNFKFLLFLLQFLVVLISYLIFDLEISVVTISIFMYFYNFSNIFLSIFIFLISLILIFGEEIISSKLN